MSTYRRRRRRLTWDSVLLSGVAHLIGSFVALPSAVFVAGVVALAGAPTWAWVGFGFAVMEIIGNSEANRLEGK